MQCMCCVHVEEGTVSAMYGLCTGRGGCSQSNVWECTGTVGYSQCNVWVVYR